ncbi:YmfQ family protein, partial [Carboxydocella sp. ULO1]|uniref:YmfQ family protein n=1 Tax=Carboxydocella sp. ULO1 TaxID=1926599 RepID=UPI0009AE184C
MSEYPITSVRGQEMLTYLPPYYETSRIIRAVLQAEGTEFDKLRQALDETLNQFFVCTATWGLDRWEKELGLPVTPDQPEAERRDKIVSRLRGYGTATIAVVKQVAESYDKGAVNVVEDHAAYTITIRFVDTTGVPPNLDDLKTAVRAVVPAHLAIMYEYNFFIWDE